VSLRRQRTSEMSAYTNAEHIVRLIEQGTVNLLPVSISQSFGEYIESLPRSMPPGNRIDWSFVPEYLSTDWYATGDEAIVTWAKRCSIGRHTFVAFWYKADEPSLLCEFSYGIANADVLTWRSPGTRYLFGLDANQGEYIPHFHDFLEFGSDSYMRGSIGR
jgi:hypothetical protein